MTDSTITLDRLRTVVSDFANKYKDINKVELFGSYAKGTETSNSDIDLIVDLADEFDEDAYWGLLETLEAEFSCKVDLLTRDGIEDSVVKDSILEGSVTLYVKP